MNAYVKRDLYLNRLIVRRNNGQIKAVYRNIVIWTGTYSIPFSLL